ncbi:MAG: hypothetical protein ACOX8K_05260 [Lachnospiraceae bacterium]
MNRKKKNFVLCVAAGVIALLLLLFWIWYAWPLPFAVFSVNETNTEGIDCLVMEAGVREGTPIIDTYRLQTKEGEEVQDMMELLKSSSYSRSYKNLLPKVAVSLGSENGNGDSVTVSITLLYKNGSDNFLFLDNGNGRLMKQSGQAVYFKADKKLTEELAGYIKEKGRKQNQ